MLTRVLLLALFAILSNVASSQEPELPLLTAAHKREAATRSVEFVGRVKETVPRGAYSPAFRDDQTKPSRLQPDAETTLESTFQLIFDGSRARHEHDHPMPPSLKPLDWLTVQNDRETKTLVRKLNPEPMGHVAKKPMIENFLSPQTAPMVLACRLSAFLAENPKGRTLEPTGKTAVVDGVACTGYRIGQVQTLWADPSRENAITRVETADGVLMHDIRHQKHGVAGWLPSSWTITRRRPSGAVQGTTTVTVETVRVGEKYADGLFELTYPISTTVADASINKEYVVGPSREELPPKEPPPGVPVPADSHVGRDWLTRNRWLGLVIVGVGLALSAVAWRVRNRRPSKPAQLLTALLFASVANTAVSQELESPFLAAARKREEATRSAEFVVTMKIIYPRGGSGPEKAGAAAPPVEPPEDTTLEQTVRLVYDGPRGRGEVDGRLDLRRQSAHSFLETHNEREVRDYADHRTDGTGVFGGSIEPPRTLAGMVRLRAAPYPILLACRLPQSIEPLASKTAEPTGTTTVIDGATCEGYRFTGRRMWADPNQDYAIRRVEDTRDFKGESYTVRYDIRHEKHPVVGWWPASWTETKRHASGRVEYTLTAMATLTNVGEKFPDELFEFKFPPGAYVADTTAHPLAQYFAGPDGGPPPPPPFVDWAWPQWAGVGFVVALLVAAAVWLVRAGRKKKARAEPAT